MASRTVVTLLDDLDESAATETVRFGLDGAAYEIDLNDEHAGELRAALAPYLDVARRAGGSANSRTPRFTPPRPRTAGDADPKVMRAWAEANGVPVNARGRLKADVVEKYRAAHG